MTRRATGEGTGVAEKMDAKKVRLLWVDLLLYPTHSLPTAAAPVAIAAGLALRAHVFAALPLLAAFMASWLVHVGGLFVDNYQLLVSHRGLREHPELSDAADAGTITLAELRWAAWGSFALACLIGVYLYQLAGWPAPVLGLIGLVTSFGYAGRPLAYARLGVADLVFVVMFGALGVAGAYYVQAAAVLGGGLQNGEVWQTLAGLPASVWLLGLPAGLLVTNVLIIDDIRDRDFDAAKGWRTISVRFGRHWSRREYLAFALVAYLAPIWFWLGLGFGPWVLLPWLTMPWAVAIGRALVRAKGREDLVALTPRAAMLSLFHAVLLAIGIALPVLW